VLLIEKVIHQAGSDSSEITEQRFNASKTKTKSVTFQ
jgi:hypothetical protein